MEEATLKQRKWLKVSWAVTARGNVFMKLHCCEHYRDLLGLASVAWNLGSNEMVSMCIGAGE